MFSISAVAWSSGMFLFTSDGMGGKYTFTMLIL
jgi:hypothetical protein